MGVNTLVLKGIMVAMVAFYAKKMTISFTFEIGYYQSINEQQENSINHCEPSLAAENDLF